MVLGLFKIGIAIGNKRRTKQKHINILLIPKYQISRFPTRIRAQTPTFSTHKQQQDRRGAFDSSILVTKQLSFPDHAVRSGG